MMVQLTGIRWHFLNTRTFSLSPREKLFKQESGVDTELLLETWSRQLQNELVRLEPSCIVVVDATVLGSGPYFCKHEFVVVRVSESEEEGPGGRLLDALFVISGVSRSYTISWNV